MEDSKILLMNRSRRISGITHTSWESSRIAEVRIALQPVSILVLSSFPDATSLMNKNVDSSSLSSYPLFLSNVRGDSDPKSICKDSGVIEANVPKS